MNLLTFMCYFIQIYVDNGNMLYILISTVLSFTYIMLIYTGRDSESIFLRRCAMVVISLETIFSLFLIIHESINGELASRVVM